MRPLGHTRCVAGLVLVAALAGCASTADDAVRVGDSAHVGDRILDLPGRAADERATIDRTLRGVAALLDQLPVPAARKGPLASLRPSRVVRGGRGLEIGMTSETIVLATADVDVAWASNAIIVAAGAIRVAHCENSVVISGRDVQISHDGSAGGGSLVVSKGNTHISHARSTLIYAVGGVEIGFAYDVRAFNALEHRASWGRIENTAIEPLFQK